MTDLAPGLKEVLSSYHALRGPARMGSIAEGVSYLTRMLTGQLPFRPGYMSRRDLRRAYVEYYLPINAAKIARILDELATVDGEFLREELRVLDFGSGPGTASLAWRLWGGKFSSHVLVDRVEEALDEAEALLGASFERAGEILRIRHGKGLVDPGLYATHSHPSAAGNIQITLDEHELMLAAIP